MTDIKFSGKLQIKSKDQNKLKKDIKRVINAKINKFIAILATKVSNIALDLGKEIKKQPVVNFIKSADGVGQLGTSDGDNIINKMLTTMVTTSSSSSSKNKVDFQIGRLAAMRMASIFKWTTLKGPSLTVNMYSLIQNEPIESAGWDGAGIPDAAFIKVGGRTISGVDLSEFSRTGEGLMVGLNRSGARPYRLPTKHIKGFSQFLQGGEAVAFKKILDKYIKESLIAVGIKVPAGRLL